MKRVEVTEEKASWVTVTVTGDPELAKEVKTFLGLVLDWAILDERQFLKVRQMALKGASEGKEGYLKLYDQTTALKSTDRLQFYIVKHFERVIEEKAGFRIE